MGAASVNSSMIVEAAYGGAYGSSGLEPRLGISLPAIGALPALVALTLYATLPILRNTVTGLNGVDPRLRDAARIIGMTPGQSLRAIELPLALPVIMAGIRTAAVWVIGTATLATPIGQQSLGNYIFTGLQTQNWVFVTFGCVAAAVLALAVDQLLALVQTGIGRRSGARLALGLLGLVAITAGALAPGWYLLSNPGRDGGELAGSAGLMGWNTIVSAA